MNPDKRAANKRVAAVIAALAIAATLVTGTFAYFAGQSALNEWLGTKAQAGGVGRDDFIRGGDGNKDVYVENKGTALLYARIRLDEFFELTLKEQEPQVIVGEEGAARESYEGWITHKTAPGEHGTFPPGIALGEGRDPIEDAHSYWNWTMGGQKVYLPAPLEEVPEDQTGGEQPPYVCEAYNDADEYSKEDMKTNQALKETPDAEVISYAQWVAEKNEAPGAYWVIAGDGWIYWAQPIAPGTATGLLLDKVELDESRLPAGWVNYYYAINVLFDFWDATGWELGFDSADAQGQAILEKIAAVR